MFYKIFLFFCFFINLASISLKNNFSKHVQSKLLKQNIYEPNIYVIFFDNNLILIGSVRNSYNIPIIIKIVKNYKKKVLNFLVYKNEPENLQTVILVKKTLKKEKIQIKDCFFFSQGRTIWIIGYSKNFYEKEKLQEVLKILKRNDKIKEFYCCLKFNKKGSKGFIFRHKI